MTTETELVNPYVKDIKDASNVRSITRESIGPGTVVKLKSGGPHMTVIERSTNWAYVTWHKDDGNDVLKDWLPTSCLEVVK